MVAEAKERKTSTELLDIAHEMLLILAAKHDLTNGEVSIVLFLMGDGYRYQNETEHFERMVKHDKQD